MNKIQLFRWLWPFLLALGIPLQYFWLMERVDWSIFLFSYTESFFIKGPYKNPVACYPYTVFAFFLLAFALYCWLKQPSKLNFVCTLFTGWVLCGLPAMSMLAALSFGSR